MGFRDWEMAQEQRRAEEASRRELEERLRVLSVHPLVNTGIDRNLREAYFNGLVFAALSDDFAVDDAEKHLLTTIASALGLDAEFTAETIANTQSVAESDDAKRQAKSLFDESLEELRKLSSNDLRRLFAAEFVKVRLLHPECEGELIEDLAKIGATIEAPVEDVLTPIAAIVKKGASASMDDVDKASLLLGDEVVKYFVVREMGRVDDALDKFRADRAASEARRKEQEENRRTLPERLAEIVECDDTWPVEFKPDDYKPLFAAAGIPDSDVVAFVARAMLPHMKRACQVAKQRIRSVPIVSDDHIWSLLDERDHGAKFEDAKEFRVLFRYAFFVDAFVDLNSVYRKYYFVGPGKCDSDYYSYSLEDYGACQLTYKRIGSERFKEIRSLFGSSCALFDRLRCKWGWYQDDVDRYFDQWNKLFAVIKKRYMESGVLSCPS